MALDPLHALVSYDWFPLSRGQAPVLTVAVPTPGLSALPVAAPAPFMVSRANTQASERLHEFTKQLIAAHRSASSGLSALPIAG